jgi:anti-sigma factor RsiW
MNKPLSRATIQEQQWVAKYVAGRLSATDADAFEDYCVAHPEMTAEVALERKMKAGIASVANASRGRFSARAPRSLPLWAAAACLVLASAGLWLIRGSGSSSIAEILTSTDAQGGRSIGASVRLAQVRGTGVANLGASSDALLRVELIADFPVDSRYRVALSERDSTGNWRVIGELDDQFPASAGSLAVLLDGARISAGDYLIAVTPFPPGPTAEFEFRKD